MNNAAHLTTLVVSDLSFYFSPSVNGKLSACVANQKAANKLEANNISKQTICNIIYFEDFFHYIID